MVSQPGIQNLVFAASIAILCAAPGFAVCGADAVATNAELRALIVKDVDGKSYHPLADAGQKATVFFFVLHDCPLANRCAPEINRIVTEYGARGIRSFVVYVEDDLSPKVARKHAREHAFTCPVLLDREQKLVPLTQVTVSPEVAVLSSENAVLYRGRIDDRLMAFGKQRVSPERRDLREALDAILEGKPVPTPVTKAVGCYLPTNENAKSPRGAAATKLPRRLTKRRGRKGFRKGRKENPLLRSSAPTFASSALKNLCGND